MSPVQPTPSAPGELSRLLAGIFLVAVAAFALGRCTAPRGGDGAQKAPERASSQSAQQTTMDTGVLADTARRLEADPAEDAQMQAARAFSEKTGLSRLAAWQAAYERVDEKNWRSIFDLTWKARLAGMISSEEQQWMWQRIGEVAGRAAMEAVKPKDPVRDWETRNGRYAMKGWAQRDPAAAWAYVESLPAGNFREGMVAGFVWGRGAVDAEKAITALQTLPEDRQAFLVRRSLEDQDGRHMTDFARAWLDTAGGDESGARQAVFAALLNAQRTLDWNDKTGEKLATWVEDFAGKPYLTPIALSQTAQRLAVSQSPEAAIEWTERIAAKSPAAASAAVAQVVSQYARGDLAAAAGWLNTHRDSPLYDQAALGFLSAARGKIDATSARDWVQTIRDPEVRGRMEKMFNLSSGPAAR